MPEEVIAIEVVSAFKVENILAAETCKINLFTVDVDAKTSTVQSVSTLEWLSGKAPCTSTSPRETVISGDEFDKIFSAIPQALYERIT